MGIPDIVRNRAGAIGRAFENLLLPSSCVLCGRTLQWTTSAQPPLCPECSIIGEGETAARCRVCSRSLISEIDMCTRCRERKFAFDANVSAFAYRGKIKELIRLYKFQHCRDLSWFFSRALAITVGERWSELPLVPVPPRASSMRARGFDPVETISFQIAHASDQPVTRLLERHGGKSQKTLDYGQRIVNLSGQISLRDCYRRNASKVPDSVVLLDDVFTTGATAHECARVLKEAGVTSVFVLTIAMD